MNETTEIIKIDSALQDIFIDEEDKKGTDLLQMSNFLELFVEESNLKLHSKDKWTEIALEGSNILGLAATAIQSGFNVSEMKMMVADTSHFSKDIVNGLKKGIYHIGESKEVAGNLRPAVLDKDEHLVKFVTLKKAFDPTAVLSDISNLSMQLSLRQISNQLEDMGKDIQSIIEFERRENLSNKFIYAREQILQAINTTDEKKEAFLIKADEYLMEGLTDLYADLNAQIKKLSQISGPFRSLKEIDKLLQYINEDMQMIPRYVGLRVYLFNVRDEAKNASRILDDYRYQLKKMASNKIGQTKYTALELLHKYYPYEEGTMDFWLIEPPKILDSLETCCLLMEKPPQEVFYIDMEK